MPAGFREIEPGFFTGPELLSAQQKSPGFDLSKIAIPVDLSERQCTRDSAGIKI